MSYKFGTREVQSICISIRLQNIYLLYMLPAFLPCLHYIYLLPSSLSALQTTLLTTSINLSFPFFLDHFFFLLLLILLLLSIPQTSFKIICISFEFLRLDQVLSFQCQHAFWLVSNNVVVSRSCKAALNSFQQFIMHASLKVAMVIVLKENCT